jgi:hypothetical protein
MSQEILAFTSIESIPLVYRSLKSRLKYRGKDAIPASDEEVAGKFPVVNYTGTVKIHGTNAGVRFHEGKLVPQSRSRALSLGSDNMGFAQFVFSHRESWENSLRYLSRKFKADDIIAYGEWCGPGIQKGVGVSTIPEKVFVIFGLKYRTKELSNVLADEDDLDSDSTYTYASVENDYLGEIANSIPNVYSILDFPMYRVTVDFNNPNEALEEIERLTQEVENDCPVARHFNSPGLGEGIVWRPTNPQWDTTKMWFKSKGEKHKEVHDTQTQKANKFKLEMDEVKSINEFTEMYLTEPRFNKGLDYLREMNISIDITSTGQFVKWMCNDILKEGEAHILDNKLNVKFLTGNVGKESAQWFKKYVSTM